MIIPPDHVTDVCKIGQGHDCCRYLVVGPGGFECAKLTSMKLTLDARGDSMTARGDNCPGLTAEEEGAEGGSLSQST